MAEVIDLIDKVKRYFWFNPLEIRGIIAAVAAIAFIISFNEWGRDKFDFAVGIMNFLLSAVIVLVSFMVHNGAQRVWSLATGYQVEFKMSGIGLVLGVIFAFIAGFFNSSFWLIVPGGIMVHHLAGHRLGWFRYDINYWAISIITWSGCIATVFFIMVLKLIGEVFPGAFIQKFIAFNIVYNIYSVLPIPPLDGSRIFFGSRWLYAFTLPFVVSTGVLLYSSMPLWVSFGGSFVIAIVLWLTYYLAFEKDVWSP